jgi:hypothetical protein
LLELMRESQWLVNASRCPLRAKVFASSSARSA